MTDEEKPVIRHLLDKYGEHKTRLDNHEQDIKLLKQRLRALERKHTNTQGTTYTPQKISHKFQIDLLNEFLKITYPVLFDIRSVNIDDWRVIQDDLNDMLDGADVGIRHNDSEFVFYCDCSNCSGDSSELIVHLVDKGVGVSSCGIAIEDLDDDAWTYRKDVVLPPFEQKCGGCWSNSDNQDKLSDHTNDYTELIMLYSCGICFKLFRDKSDLKSHEAGCLEKEHKVMDFMFNDFSATVVDNSDNPSGIGLIWYCNRCDARSSSYLELLEHKGSEHMVGPIAADSGDNGDNITLGIDGSVEATPYLCGDCDKGFDTVEGINEHMSSEHMDDTPDHMEFNPVVSISDTSSSFNITKPEGQTVEFRFHDLKCGICEELVSDFGNIAIIGYELFDYDCVVSSRKMATPVNKVHLLKSNRDMDLLGSYCDVSITDPSSYFTSNLDQELASYQEWCADCLLVYVHREQHLWIELADKSTFTWELCDLCKINNYTVHKLISTNTSKCGIKVNYDMLNHNNIFASNPDRVLKLSKQWVMCEDCEEAN